MSNSPLNLVYAKDVNTSLSTYENSTYDITIKYPHSWSFDESGGIDDTDVDIVTFSGPNQYDIATVDIHQDKLGNGNSDIGAYLKSEILVYNDNLDDFKVFDSNINS